MLLFTKFLTSFFTSHFFPLRFIYLLFYFKVCLHLENHSIDRNFIRIAGMKISLLTREKYK